MGKKPYSLDKNQNITIKDVAKLAGVGTTTVSRVLNGSGPVSERTKEKVLSAMEELNFKPHIIARGLRTNRLPIVGMIISDISNPLFAEIVQSAHSILTEKGYQLVLGITNGNLEEEARLLTSFMNQGVSGIIASLIDDTTKNISKTIQALPVPIVLLDRQLRNLEMNTVTHDHKNGTKEAVDYLLNLGHTRIAFVLNSERTYPGRARKEAILSQLQSKEISLPEDLISIIPSSPDKGYQVMMDLLSREEKPTAVVVGNNQIFIGILQAIREKKLRYPDDISLISFDNVYLTQLLEPPITIVNRNLKDLGIEAANLILEQIQSPSKGVTKRILPTWLEQRGSCRSILIDY